MTKHELIATLAAREGLSQEFTNRLFAAACALVREVLLRCGEVRLPAIGTLDLVEAAPREGMAPDGTPYQVPAHCRVRYRVAESLKEAAAARPIPCGAVESQGAKQVEPAAEAA